MARTSEAQIVYTPRTDATTETEPNVLAAVYKFILDCHAKKQGRPTTSGPDDAEGSKNDRTATEISPSHPECLIVVFDLREPGGRLLYGTLRRAHSPGPRVYAAERISIQHHKM